MTICTGYSVDRAPGKELYYGGLRF
jgi:hypothetical protein